MNEPVALKLQGLERIRPGATRAVSKPLPSQDLGRVETTRLHNDMNSAILLHSSGADLDRVAAVAASPSGSRNSQINDSRSQSASLSSPLPSEGRPIGSRRLKQVRWTEVECELLLSTVGPLGPAGKIDHKSLLSKWDAYKRDGVVEVERTSDALVAKYRALQKSGLCGTSQPPLVGMAAAEMQCLPNPAMDVSDRPILGEAADISGSSPRAGDLELVNGYAAGLGDDERSTATVKMSSEDLVGYDDFKVAFDRVFAVVGKGHRFPVRALRGRHIPVELLQCGDRAIRDAMENRNGSLGHLNRAVYSAAQVIADRIVGEGAVTTRNWFVLNKRKTLVINRNLGKLKSIMDRLKAAQPLTTNQRRNLSTLRRIYGSRYRLNSIEQMGVLYHDLAEHLKKCQRLRKVMDEANSRKRARWAPLSTVLRTSTVTSETPVNSVRDYWEKIIGAEQEFRKNKMLRSWASAVRQEVAQKLATQQLPNRERDWELWQQVCKKARPFKAAGPDGIQNFWWKVFPFANRSLYDIIVGLRENPTQEIPSWICHGRAVSLYKGKGDPKDPGNYRTIACLNTCYKFVTGMIARWIDDDVRDVSSARPVNQMALRKGVWATTHSHVLDRTIVQDCVGHKGRQLSVAWIDFEKAFDSIPHKYIVWVLETIGVSGHLRVLLAGLMSRWELTFEGFNGGRMRKSAPLKVTNGVLQGDTLSPLLFCLSVSPISHYLNTTLQKYRTSTGCIGGALTTNGLELNHLYYVDDLVIYTPKPADLCRAVQDIDVYARDFGLRLNASKSAKYLIGSPGLEELGDGWVRTTDPDLVPTLHSQESYRYLGIDKSRTVDTEQVFRRVRESVLRKADAIFGSDLTFRQKVNAFNAAAIPVAKYLFANEIIGSGKFDGVLAKSDALDQEIRTLLVKHLVRHRGSSRSRLYLDSEQGGLGLRNFRSAACEAIAYSYCYVALRPDLRTSWYLMEVLQRRGKRSLISDFCTIVRDHGIADDVVRNPEQPSLQVRGSVFTDPTKAARAITALLHSVSQARLLEEFLSLPYASRVVQNEQLDTVLSFLWLRKGLVSSKVVNNIIAASEGQLLIKGHPSRKNVDRTCRLKCSELPAPLRQETAEHILSVCPHWRTTLMVKRHNSVARNIYYALCVKYGFTTRHYNQEIEGYRQRDSIGIYWDHPIITTKKVLHHRPDIVIIDNELKTATIVEVSVSWHTRICTQEGRKYSKYAVNSTLPENTELDSQGTFPAGDNLACELGRDLGYVVTVLPLVVGALGEVSKNLLRYLLKLGLTGSKSEYLLERMSRSAVLGSAAIIKAHCSVRQDN